MRPGPTISPTVWLTGLSGSGKSTLARRLAATLSERGRPVEVLDGDVVRRSLSADLGFSREDRRENIRRVALRCRELNASQIPVIAALISPYADDRAMAAEIIGPERFREIYLSTTLLVCEARDPKGLYLKARRGEISGFTGVDAPYEPPTMPCLTLDTAVLDIDQCVKELLIILSDDT
ncbi:MAG: adenylyl-sulfate kinase [Betaproteobacteria bacterium]|nr:adenylyl-sulfate kinase [Betaproteobacteria bacterium]